MGTNGREGMMGERKPVRVIEGNAAPYEAFWRFIDAAKSESGETEIEFFGPISEFSWWGDEITPKTFKDELYEKGKGQPVTLKVHSPGGDALAGKAIRSILQDYPGKVTAEVIGLAASAATVVTTGADVVKMRDTAMYMIHNTYTMAVGDAKELRQVADVLDQMVETTITAYERKTKLSREKIAQMMDDETWLSASEALELGFVDEVTTGGKKKPGMKNQHTAFLNCVKGYRNAPEEVIREWTPMDANEEEEVHEFARMGTNDPLRGGEGEEEKVMAAEEADNEAGRAVEELRARVNVILGKD
jgi:ATP-dependent Clp protease, protease subunit